MSFLGGFEFFGLLYIIPEEHLPIGEFFLWIQLFDILEKIKMEIYFKMLVMTLKI